MEHDSQSILDEIGQILARGIVALQMDRERDAARARSEGDSGLGDDNCPLETFLAAHPGSVTCGAVASHLGLSLSTARSRLNALVESGQIRREGKGPATVYLWVGRDRPTTSTAIIKEYNE